MRAGLGLAPKTQARILRFSQALRCLRSGQTASLAETAVMCGYFDQAHLACYRPVTASLMANDG